MKKLMVLVLAAASSFTVLPAFAEEAAPEPTTTAAATATATPEATAAATGEAPPPEVAPTAAPAETTAAPATTSTTAPRPAGVAAPAWRQRMECYRRLARPGLRATPEARRTYANGLFDCSLVGLTPERQAKIREQRTCYNNVPRPAPRDRVASAARSDAFFRCSLMTLTPEEAQKRTRARDCWKAVPRITDDASFTAHYAKTLECKTINVTNEAVRTRITTAHNRWVERVRCYRAANTKPAAERAAARRACRPAAPPTAATATATAAATTTAAATATAEATATATATATTETTPPATETPASN